MDGERGGLAPVHDGLEGSSTGGLQHHDHRPRGHRVYADDQRRDEDILGARGSEHTIDVVHGHANSPTRCSIRRIEPTEYSKVIDADLSSA